ncbi:hypothetical protein JRO89_XS12G0242500 [Xanthoceras sorbifolium]|uniref:Protease Do-like 8, chloroplastic n=1 Tax=Xanthoceras sorbifolium TaxID=99658 RepID=A0ABQ8HDQ3_9ROSI|nr:hypothetical protein JRO89_XS12G0242500 [Xanthoceras sorbifolium]
MAMVKLNVDAALCEASGLVGIGLVLRDEEAAAMVKGLRFARDVRVSLIIPESDSSSFVGLVFGQGQSRHFTIIRLVNRHFNGGQRITGKDRNCIEDLGEVICENVNPFTKRRTLLTSFILYLCYHPSRYLSAQALEAPSVTVEQVTPPVFPSGALFPTEERIVQLFENNTYAVVNIFDVTLRPQLNITGVVEIPEGNGSGVVWDEQGHIVTNYHVIGNALSRNPSQGQVVARVNILASEGVLKNFEGKLVGADRAKDLAVLKVEASEDLLRPIKVGQSSSLKVGQQCLAIGNPFGFDHTLTVGVVSGLNRDIFSKTGVTIGGGIQTDAAINPGNSGGPLLDSKGNLVGINTAIFTQTGTSAGVGFAIPSSTVLKIVPQLIQYGKASSCLYFIRFTYIVVRAGLNVKSKAETLRNSGDLKVGKLICIPDFRVFKEKELLLDLIEEFYYAALKYNREFLLVFYNNSNSGDRPTLFTCCSAPILVLPFSCFSQ